MIENKIINGLGELFEEFEEKGQIEKTDFKDLYKRGNERIRNSYEESQKKQNISRYNLSQISIN